MKTRTTALTAVALLAACGAAFAAEGKLKTFLGDSQFEIQQVFKGGRFPNVVVAVDGTVLAFWGGSKVRRSVDGGKSWGTEIPIAKGHMGGGVTVNETNGGVEMWRGGLGWHICWPTLSIAGVSIA